MSVLFRNRTIKKGMRSTNSTSATTALDYYNALETYAVRGELGEFADLVAELEEQQLDVYRPIIGGNTQK